MINYTIVSSNIKKIVPNMVKIAKVKTPFS